MDNIEERQVMENMEENCEMIWKIWKKGKSNSDKIWTIWKKGKLNSEWYGKYGRKVSGKDMENMEERQVK